ncbi:MAG: glycosyltransferase family 4 protein [Bacteroidaceae bacterium]|jgi:glycosyltransferase involved in cell wall biosynthesis|nr:glycosyltransferase family 4 protein [Bacteroidaceae bacterium]
MKLLYFTIQINMIGGLARILIDKINWLVAHGYDVTLCNIERVDVLPAYALDERVKVIRGDISTTAGNALTRLRGVLGAINRVREIIKEVQPDIIVNAHCPLVTWVLPFVSTKIPKIVEIHQSRQGLEMLNRWAMNGFSRWLHKWSIRWIYGLYDKFVVLTSGDQKAWNLRNCMVIPNFSNYSEQGCLASIPREREEKAQYQIIMLARLVPQKRIDLMVQIWAKLAKDFPQWQVKVLGEGWERPRLEVQILRTGLHDTFLLPGQVKNVTAELQKSDILCLTSEYEGFGIVLIEAMLKGVPVIAFDYVGVDDIIENGVDGYVVPFGDIDTYVNKLKLMMSSFEERDRLVRNALSSVRKFDKEDIMKRWVQLFNETKR